jgi:hypothetical protein
MSELCKVTPLLIALDEELIGVFSYKDKEALLLKIKPQYIIFETKFYRFSGKKNGSHLLKVSNRLVDYLSFESNITMQLRKWTLKAK